MIDPGLIKRCQLGEESAYDELFKLIGKKALWTAFLIAGNMELAEEVIQEAFFEAFKKIGKLKSPEAFTVWFNRILIRICWYMVSREKKKVTTSLDDNSATDLKMDDDSYELAELRQVSQAVRDAVNKLSSAMRTTVILYYFNEMPIKEIAEVMGCFQGTVKSRLHYAKKELGKLLKDEFSEEWLKKEGQRYRGKECAANE